MKTPRFEELAKRYAGKAEVYFVFSEEAHPRAAANDRLNGFADQVAKLDRDGDGAVTLSEYGSFGPRFMFDAFDVDHDGVIHSHELLAARRIDQFRGVDEAKTYEERVGLARRFRGEVPGSIRILIDRIDNPTAKAYGELPDSAYVIERGGKVALKLAWAAVGDVDRALAKLTGAPSPSPTAPDLSPIASAMRTATKPVLVELVAPGCDACTRMGTTTLADPDVTAQMSRFHVVQLGVENDPAWRMFESLDLASTPAFVIVDHGKVSSTIQGYQARDKFLAFLRTGS